MRHRRAWAAWAAVVLVGCGDSSGPSGEVSAPEAWAAGAAGGNVAGNQPAGGGAAGSGSWAGGGGAGGAGAAGEAGAGGGPGGAAGQASAGAASGGDGGAAGSTDGVACGATLPGPDLEPGVVEDNPDYEFEAAALDVSALPESINLSDEGPVQSAVVGYMLGKPGSLLGFLKSEATGPLGEAVLVAFAASKGKSLDFFRLRQGLHSRYACSAAFPATLDGFKALYGDYTVWEGETLDSAPKCGQRRIWRRKDGLLSVAETLDETVVRETEVVRSGRADGALDFAVYTGDGNLTNRSTFATHGGGTIVASAPYTCMACHVSPDTMTYDVVFPEGTGACAK